MGDEKSVIVNDNNSVKAIELRRPEPKSPKALVSLNEKNAERISSLYR